MHEDIAGRTAVVTGGARGLGYSLASAYAAHGATVALLDVLPDVVESAATLSAEYGVAATGTVVDVTDAAAVDAAFAEAEQALGTASILLTAAGITSWADAVDVPEAEWRRVMSVNLDGTFYAAQAFGRRAIAQGVAASATFISSMSAFIVNVPQRQASYNASKAAVSHLAASLAVEWAPHNVRVNAIAPGYFLSQMTRDFIDKNQDLKKQWEAMIPLGRMGEPEDLHGLAVYLASDSSRYLTGQSIVIDGGYSVV